MTNKQLIEFLSKQPEDAKVYLSVDTTIPHDEKVPFEIEVVNNEITFYWMN